MSRSLAGSGGTSSQPFERLDTRIGHVEPTVVVADHGLDPQGISAPRPFNVLIISVYRLGGISSIVILRYAPKTWKPQKVIR